MLLHFRHGMQIFFALLDVKRGLSYQTARSGELEYNEGSYVGGDLVSTWVAKQRRAYRGLVTS